MPIFHVGNNITGGSNRGGGWAQYRSIYETRKDEWQGRNGLSIFQLLDNKNIEIL